MKLNWDATPVNKLLGSRITTPLIVMDVLCTANLLHIRDKADSIN